MKKLLSVIMALVLCVLACSAALAAAGDGVLDISYSIVPDTLTPFRQEANRDAPFWTQVCESLAVFSGDKVLTPWLAKSWSTEDNGFTYTVELNEGIKDSAGNPFTAADAVWFIQESMTRGLKPVFNKIESVEATGELTFSLKLKSNIVGTFDKILTESYGVTKAAFEASPNEFATELVCTSPYKVTKFVAASEFQMELRDDYWQPIENLPECVRPAVSKIRYMQITESSQIGIALETGVVDMAMRMPISVAKQFEGNNKFTIERSNGHQGYQLFYSGAESSPVGNDPYLRQAINYAISAEALVTAICDGWGTTMHDAHSPIMIGYDTDWDSQPYFEYSVEKAKELLAKSNYKGEPLSLMATSGGDNPRVCQILQAFMMQAGINCELNMVDFAYFFASRLDGTKYDMLINTIGGTFLADAWAIRYDPNAYASGDGTGRKDYVLGELLYKTWTPNGYTKENINEVHNYLIDSGIAYGMYNPDNVCAWRADLGLENEVHEIAGTIAPAYSTFSGGF